MKYKIITTFFVGILALSLGQVVWAQEFPTLSTLAQNYLMRTNIDGITSSSTLRTTTIPNPEKITKEAIEESIDTITKTVGEFETLKKDLISEIKSSIKKDIDTSIITIRKETEKPSYELQRAVDDERTRFFEDVTKMIESINQTQDNMIEEVRLEVIQSIQKIQDSLDVGSDEESDFNQSRKDIDLKLIKFEQLLFENKKIIESREGSKIFEDSDSDGLSDYDELYMYSTDPNNSRTVGDEKTDGEKVAEGINPLSDNYEKINYQDPREDTVSFVTNQYNVQKVQLIKDGTAVDTLMFSGKAFPNSYIVLYIYSTPITVVTKTDNAGSWTYELEKEIENGEHQMFVASVDNMGKIIARSNPILFTKTAHTASIGIAGSLNNSSGTQNFLKDNLILISLALLIVVVILSMMFLGNHKNIKSVVTELKNEIDKR